MIGLAAPDKKFVFTKDDFQSIQDKVYKLAGIHLEDQKTDLVYSRLTKRLRELGLTSFQSYLDLVDSPEGAAEIERMLNALTTNLTSFFREAHHFDHLKTTALGASVERQNGTGRRLRIWSSACSTGEEPYSIAMTLLESPFDLAHADVRILATDLNTEVLEQASSGHYSASVLTKCPDFCRRYVQMNQDGSGVMNSSLRDLIRFKQLNLLSNWPMKGPFDIIFCRNVLIYFDCETKQRLVDRFVGILKPGGWLYLGHSESTSGNHPKLESLGHTIYRKML
ncbi:MAG: protein-glutamate O-methyltransferase CheR [Pseudomonadota bacterium]